MMRACLLIGLLLLLPLKVAGEPLLFEFDDMQTAAIQSPLEAELVADGQRAVHLNLAALAESGRLNLPDGMELDLTLTEVEKDVHGDWVWHGRIQANDGQWGSATFTVNGQRVAGLFSIGHRQFELMPMGAGRHVLLEFDPKARPAAHPPSGPLVPELEQASSSITVPESYSADTAEDEKPVIDVLALYTDEALSQAVDEQSLRLSIRNAINATNTVFINSLVEQRVRLVAQAPLSLGETAMDDDLGRLRTNSTAAALRDRHAADLVALIGRYTGSGFCGIAYLKTGIEDGWETVGFSNTRRSCLSNQTLAHELGHNMGLAHDPANTDQEPEGLVRPFAYGHRVDGEFRTIMSYVDGCSSCPQIMHFSNPDVDSPNDIPTGIADERDNVRTLAFTAESVASYREPMTTLGDALNAADLEWRTGGGGLWYVQDDVTRNDQPVPASGPLVGEESSWLAVQLEEPTNLSFDWQTRFSGDHAVTLDIVVNGEVVESLQSDEETWQQASLAIEALEPEIRFQVTAPDEAEFDSIGTAYVTNVSIAAGEILSGRVLNTVGQGIGDVEVIYQPEIGDSETRMTGDDGGFVINLATGSLDEADVLSFQGQGLSDGERPALECQGVGSVCEEVLSGAARSVSGSVTGLGPDETFQMALQYRDFEGDRQVFSTQEVTSDASGSVTFQLDADSSVHYERVVAQVNGYSGGTFAPDGGISLRGDDLDGVNLSMSALSPNFTSVETVETGSDSFVASAMIQTFGRTQEVTLRYGKSGLNQSMSKTIEGDMDDRSEVQFEVSGVDCGSTYSWRMEAVSNNGTEANSPTRSAQTTACAGGDGGGSSSSSGCSLSPGDARLDPAFSLLALMALFGLMARSRRRRV